MKTTALPSGSQRGRESDALLGIDLDPLVMARYRQEVLGIEFVVHGAARRRVEARKHHWLHGGQFALCLLFVRMTISVARLDDGCAHRRRQRDPDPSTELHAARRYAILQKREVRSTFAEQGGQMSLTSRTQRHTAWPASLPG